MDASGEHDCQVRRVGLQRPVDVVRARRAAAHLAEWLGWAAMPCARLDVVVAELTTNAVTHGGGGSLRLEALRQPRAEIRLVCTDHGRTIAAPSTGLGLGLAVVTELANQVEITSVPDGGTCVVAELWAA